MDFKRRGALLLAALMLCLLVAGCGAENKTEMQSQQEAETNQATSPEQQTDNKPQQTQQQENTQPTAKPEEETTTPVTTEPGHTHTWVSDQKNATCAEEGYIRSKCSCGEVKNEVILPKAQYHDYKSASCTEPKKCNVCGVTEGNARGHQWADASFNAPKTCRSCGITEGDPLDAPALRIKNSFPSSFTYYTRTFDVQSVTAELHGDSLAYVTIRLSMSATRTDRPQRAEDVGSLRLKVRVYNDQGVLVSDSHSLNTADLKTGQSGADSISVPVTKYMDTEYFILEFYTKE